MTNTIIHPTLGAFTLLRAIGHGSYATVFLAKHEESGLFAALKIFKDLNFDINQIFDEAVPYHSKFQPPLLNPTDEQQELELIKRELRIMHGVYHPLIVNLFDCFQYNKQLIFLSEYIDGQNLLNYVNDRGCLDERTARTMFSQMLLILDFVHNQKQIVHRDLKCENFMVDQWSNVHLIDFGFAKSFSNDDRQSTNLLLNTICGSPAYIAPEIIRNFPYDKSVDIWSLGIILYAITHGQLPFDDINTNNLLLKVVKSEPEYDKSLSPGLIDLLKSILKKNPAERATLEQIKNHEWITMDNGRQWCLSDKVFMNYMLVSTDPNGEILIDDKTLQLLNFTKQDKIEIQNDIKNRRRTKKALMYMLMRKSTIQFQIKHSGKMIFLPTTQNLPQRVHTFSAFINKSTCAIPRLLKHNWTRQEMETPQAPTEKFTSNHKKMIPLGPLSPIAEMDFSGYKTENVHPSPATVSSPELKIFENRLPPTAQRFPNGSQDQFISSQLDKLAQYRRSSMQTNNIASLMVMNQGVLCNPKPKGILYRKLNSNC